MLNATERMQRILTANPPTLARIDAVLCGEDTSPVPIDADNRLITYADASRRTGLSRPTLYRLTRTGRIDTVQLCGTTRIVLRSIDALINGERPADGDNAREIERVRIHRAAVMSANRRPRTAKVKGKVNG